MKVCGIIAEYNPFHNGHLYHINKTKEETACDDVVCVMSGNFIQRGMPALFDKWTRTEMALSSGVDLVIELPTVFSTASAEYFARGAVSILNSLGVVDFLSFGNTCNNISLLKEIATTLANEPDELKKDIASELKRGISYPLARSNALKKLFKKKYPEELISETLLDSNNILGIEYLKSLYLLNSKIEPIAIERKGTSYNSTDIINDICSATAIREMFKTHEHSNLSNVVPSSSFELINNEILNGRQPMFIDNFEKEILYAIRKYSLDELSNISDVTEGIENTIKKSATTSANIDTLIDTIKSKRYTKTRVQRILTHILLDIKKADIEKDLVKPEYIRVLGFTKKGKDLLSTISRNSDIPVVTSVNKFIKNASSSQKIMIEKDILASNIYTLGYQVPIYKKMNLDYTMPLIEI